MNQHIDASALDAIEAVAEEGFKRSRTGKRTFLLVVVLVTFFASAVGAVVWITEKNKENDSLSGQLDAATSRLEKLEPTVGLNTLDEWPVAVLLPDMEKSSVLVNAARQWQGFESAFRDHDVDPENRHRIEFDYPFKGEEGIETKEEIIKELDAHYEKGIRTFVITMSGATLGIKKKFVDWVNNLSVPVRDRPVLVATVASAPKIVDRENGIFRHYIRSEDESSVLATYIESLGVQDVGVFHVSDPYGDSAKDILKNRFTDTKTEVYPYLVNLGPQEDLDIPKRVDDFVADMRPEKKAVAVIIGYGAMIEKTLTALKDKFDGDILVVSTFTEEEWRGDLVSEDEEFASRIRFIGPGAGEDDPDLRGVVFQFSYLTLDRALKCGRERGVDAFWNCWQSPATKTNETGKDWAKVEFTADGDSHVSLRLLKVDE